MYVHIDATWQIRLNNCSWRLWVGLPLRTLRGLFWGVLFAVTKGGAFPSPIWPHLTSSDFILYRDGRQHGAEAGRAADRRVPRVSFLADVDGEHAVCGVLGARRQGLVQGRLWRSTGLPAGWHVAAVWRRQSRQKLCSTKLSRSLHRRRQVSSLDRTKDWRLVSVLSVV